jgi:hypothetical protein
VSREDGCSQILYVYPTRTVVLPLVDMFNPSIVVPVVLTFATIVAQKTAYALAWTDGSQPFRLTSPPDM